MSNGMNNAVPAQLEVWQFCSLQFCSLQFCSFHVFIVAVCLRRLVCWGRTNSFLRFESRGVIVPEPCIVLISKRRFLYCMILWAISFFLLAAHGPTFILISRNRDGIFRHLFVRSFVRSFVWSQCSKCSKWSKFRADGLLFGLCRLRALCDVPPITPIHVSRTDEMKVASRKRHPGLAVK